MIRNRHLVEPACFDVHTEEIYATTDSGLAVQIPGIENYRSVVASEDRRVLGVSTSKYGVLPNRQAFDMVFSAINEIGADAEVVDVSMGGGDARVRATIEFPEIVCDPGDGHTLNYRLVVENSYNGSTNFGFQHGAFRLVCTNGMIIGVRTGQFKFRHTGSIENNFEQVLNQFKTMLPNAAEMVRNGVQGLVHAPLALSVDDTRDLIVALASLPAKYHKGFTEMANDNNTRTHWDAYNHFTDMITHDDKGKASSFRKDQLLGNVHDAFSRIHKLNASRSMELLNELRAA